MQRWTSYATQHARWQLLRLTELPLHYFGKELVLFPTTVERSLKKNVSDFVSLHTLINKFQSERILSLGV